MTGYLYYKTPTNINLLNTMKINYNYNNQNKNIFCFLKNLDNSEKEFISEKLMMFIM